MYFLSIEMCYICSQYSVHSSSTAGISPAAAQAPGLLFYPVGPRTRISRQELLRAPAVDSAQVAAALTEFFCRESTIRNNLLYVYMIFI
jgi:hypothetical protein